MLNISPIDKNCKEIKVPTEMHNNLYWMAHKRTAYIRNHVAYGNINLNQMLAIAYVQGMTDLAEAIS